MIHLRYFVWKHQFDTIVDYKYELHDYTFYGIPIDTDLIPIEIYNMRINWDIKVIFYGREKEIVYKNPEVKLINKESLLIPINYIIKETKKWIIEKTDNKFLKLWYKLLFKLGL